MNEVVVIGAGPAGLMAAISAASNDSKVLLLEKMEKPGKKLLLSGSGQCNITHNGSLNDFSNNFGEKKKAAYRILRKFSNQDLLSFFNQLGLRVIQREDGKYFPESKKSSDVIDCLLENLSKKKVKLVLNASVTSIQKMKETFVVKTLKENYHTKNVICATGGFTYPKTGSDGSFFSIAKQMGHQIIPLGRGLTPVFISDKKMCKLSGVSISNASLTFQGKKGSVITKKGELLITHKGLSGPLIIDNSRFFHPGMDIRLNFTPFDNTKHCQECFVGFSIHHGKKSAASFFWHNGVPKRLVSTLFSLAHMDSDIPLSQLTKEKRKEISEIFTAFPITIQALGSIHEAMVTTGGIDLNEIKLSTMESKKVKNLYFCGEMIDIDGDTGGYNIQMAFSTGYIAGKAASE